MSSATSTTRHDIGPVTALILAGGLARRMGGQDKGLIEVAGRAMVVHVADALRPQVDALVVNANRNQSDYAALLEVPVLSDVVGDFAGPLAGMLSGLRHIAGGWLLSCPCDSPVIAGDLVARMVADIEREGCQLAVAHDGERLQPVFALLARALADDLAEFLDSGERKIDRWYARHRFCAVDFHDRQDMFININTPQERERFEQTLRGGASRADANAAPRLG
ncbi:MAG: molybdenum cofactor guanylyltransferase [Gammaproteobacteria bacterium]|nr:molybdenum cofactor guanylyltransferase [Gammaproteobacteria bacterium]